MQTVHAFVNDRHVSWDLPDPDDEIMLGIRWGHSYEVASPAFWLTLARTTDDPTFGYISRDGDLLAEVGFCLLGGYGVTAEVAQAAFERLREAGVFAAESISDEATILGMLQRPLTVEGREVRYRFPRQRSKRIAEALSMMMRDPPNQSDPIAFRHDLMKLPGIGPKTASWIVRNHTGSNEVAILDVHIVRACQAMGLFGQNVRLPGDYLKLEARFLEFARRLGVEAAALDALIWTSMRRFGRALRPAH